MKMRLVLLRIWITADRNDVLKSFLCSTNNPLYRNHTKSERFFIFTEKRHKKLKLATTENLLHEVDCSHYTLCPAGTEVFILRLVITVYTAGT
ncbi:uncharacterized protein LOC143254150 isoform X2 [Tachypleus tridentatus]|uniref:uncharacterized protein LOC143254150 isoform X2 n=1 Tax=Tachypleus tridentatus TaxID=6853 RepID=UPI003FD50A54